MKVLIIGGTALLGPHLVRELFEHDIFEVHTLTRTGKRILCENAHSANRRDKDELLQVLRLTQPDVIVDMIPFTEEDATILVTALETLKLRVPVIALSSIDVYSAYSILHRTESLPIQQCPITEDMESRTQLGPEGSSYDKLSVESVYRRLLDSVCILRLPAIYGWPDTTRVSHYLDRMLDGDSVIEIQPDEGNWTFSRSFHKNVAHAIYLAVRAELPGKNVFNVSEKEALTTRQWIQRIASICGWRGQIIEKDSSGGTLNWKQDFYVNSEKIRRQLAYDEKYCTNEGLADTIAFHSYQRTGRAYKKYY